MVGRRTTPDYHYEYLEIKIAMDSEPYATIAARNADQAQPFLVVRNRMWMAHVIPIKTTGATISPHNFPNPGLPGTTIDRKSQIGNADVQMMAEARLICGRRMAPMILHCFV